MKKIHYIIHSNSFGDTLAATPTLRYLHKSHQTKINVVTHNKNVFKNNPYIDQLLSFDEFVSKEDGDVLKYESFTFPGQLDKNGIEKKFSHIDTRLLHAMDLGFQLLPEDMSYDFYPDPLELNVKLPEHYVVLHITTNWANRTWDKENWQKLINWLNDNKVFTVLIGFGYQEKLHNSLSDTPLEKFCPHFENLYGLDLTNQGSVSDMWWIINGSSCIVTMDSGPLHIAGCTDTHILQLGSAINPKFRAPYRHGSQDYKYNYIGGSCEIFCNSNLFYNVLHWGDINHIPPQPGCLENKSTFECHPSVEKVIEKIKESISFYEDNRFLKYIDFLPNDEPNKLKFNFKKTSDDVFTMIIKDVTTGLTRDKYSSKCERLSEGYFWWSPMPGTLENLGDIDMFFYVNDEFIGEKRFFYPGGQEMIIKGEKYYLDYLNGNNYPTFWEIFINGDYDTNKNCVVEKDDVVLDIGGNYGFFTLNAIIKGASKIYSVEPYKPAFDHINKLSQKFTEIIPINMAVSKTDGVVQMFVNEDASATNCVTNYGELFGRESNETEVNSININTLLDSIPERINFMKVDCEGSEMDIFQTITEKNIRRIDKMVIETHGDEIDTFVYNKLISSNFKVYRKDYILFATNYN